jgi:hypothetical protein
MRDTADLYASLVESVRVNGKPRQRHVAYLGSLRHESDVHFRAWRWQEMRAKLDALGNRIPGKPWLRVSYPKNVFFFNFGWD